MNRFVRIAEKVAANPSADVGWKVPVYDAGAVVASYVVKASTAGEAKRLAMAKAKADGKDYAARQFGKPKKLGWG